MNIDPLLTQLENVQLLHRLSEPPDLVYVFKHALTQEAAYDSLLKAKRAELHRRVAETIENLWGDQLEQNAAVLALHYERARIDDKAFTYAVLAGDVARREYAHQEALAFYDRALEIARRLADPRLTPQVRAVYANRGNVFEMMANHSAASDNYKAMIEFARQVGDVVIEADATNHLVTATVVPLGQFPDAQKQLEYALALARKAGDQELICRALWNIGLSCRFEDPLRAENYFQQALDIARAANLDELVAFALVDLMGGMRITGRWRLALEYGREALEKFRAADNKPMAADVLGGMAAMLHMSGETAKARAAAKEGAEICRAIDNPWGLHVNELNLLEIDFAAGDFMRTLSEGARLLDGARAIGFPLFVGLALMLLARAYLELNQLERAEALADESAQVLDGMQTQLWSTMGQGFRGRVLVSRGELARARTVLEPMWHVGEEPVVNFYGFISAGPAVAEFALAEKRDDFGLQFCNWLLGRYEQEEVWGLAAEIYFLRAQVHAVRGSHAEAKADLIRAREILERAENKTLLWRVDAALAAIYARCSENAKAGLARQRAAGLVRTIAEKISDPALHKSFLTQSDVVELLR